METDETLPKEQETKSPEELGVALRSGAVVHAEPEDDDDEKPEEEKPSDEGAQ